MNTATASPLSSPKLDSAALDVADLCSDSGISLTSDKSNQHHCGKALPIVLRHAGVRKRAGESSIIVELGKMLSIAETRSLSGVGGGGGGGC